MRQANLLKTDRIEDNIPSGYSGWNYKLFLKETALCIKICPCKL